MIVTFYNCIFKLYFDISTVLELETNYYKNKMTERGGSVVAHETRIREVPGSNPGADQPHCGFPQSSMQILGWIFITTIHLIIIHHIHIS